ncbi:hypothetical protein ACHHYP_08299 [Achlya hypogyna]|uniref:Importin N-terminal domain-containing protein n=1 Tax=Achlya hypogyna TaxID=1202772 RepID=A0A1V9ZKT8_ACHHY|nr:hypothetical protein ACHHYP_08299 [Achlya hypogyna]
MDEFIHCCDVLLVNGSAGSAAQREAHDRLLRFQQDPSAWQLVLRVLMSSMNGVAISEAALFIAARLLRSAIPVLEPSEQVHVRDHLIQFLCANRPRTSLSVKPVERLVCLALASAVVQVQQDWPSWKERLHSTLLQTQSTPLGLMLLLEVLSGIPGEIYSQCSLAGPGAQVAEMVQAFQKDAIHVMNLIRETLVSIPDAAFVALTCLQNWGHDVMPVVEIEFGLCSVDLSEGQLFDVLIDLVVSPKVEVSQLAAEIIADTLSHTNSSPALGNIPAQRYEREATLVVRVAKRIAATKPVILQATAALSAKESSEDSFMDDPNLEAAVAVARGLAKVASIIAFAHSHCVFAGGWCEAIRRAEGCPTAFGEVYLEFLVLCTSFPDPSVTEETLEFWFFIFEMKKRWNDIPSLNSWAEFLPAALPVVQQVVVLLIHKCQYPTWFLASNRLTSDHPAIDATRDLRRYIGDTLLNIFVNWPNSEGELGSYMCLETVVRLVQSSKDLQQVDALLFVLDYLVELFDFDDIDTDDDALYLAVQRLWQSAIEVFPSFPDHPLLMQGVSRLVSSLVVSIQFEERYYTMLTVVLAQGLAYPAVCSSAAKALLKLSNALSKSKTSAAIKGECIQQLLAAIDRPDVLSTLFATPPAYGDFLEALLRLGAGLSDTDYMAVINCAFPRILSALRQMTKESNAAEVETVLYLLSRGLNGIRQPAMRDAFLSEHWSLVRPIAVDLFADNAKVRELAVGLFASVFPASTRLDLVLDILDTCVRWHRQYAAPYVLSCLGTFASSCAAKPSLHPHLTAVLQSVFESVAAKLDYDPTAPLETMQARMHERFQRPQEDLGVETVQYFQMLRDAVPLVPEVVCRNPGFLEVLKLGCVLLSIDHQLPDVTDALCSFFVDALTADEAETAAFATIADVLMNAILHLLAGTPTSSKKRCLQNIFFQVLQASTTRVAIRDVFAAALNRALLTTRVFPSMAPTDALLLSQMLLGTREKRKFHVLTTTTATYLQGLGAAPWLTPTLYVTSPRSPQPLAFNEIIDVMN